VHPNAAAVFAVSVQTVIGDVAATLFWTDWWLEGKSLAELAPNLVTAVPKRVTKSRIVQQAMLQAVWVQDIRGNLTPQAFGEFFLLCPRSDCRDVHLAQMMWCSRNGGSRQSV
jgi:hypothetical protein